MIRTKVTANVILAGVDSSSLASCLYIWLVLPEKGFEAIIPLNQNRIGTKEAALQRNTIKTLNITIERVFYQEILITNNIAIQF